LAPLSKGNRTLTGASIGAADAVYCGHFSKRSNPAASRRLRSVTLSEVGDFVWTMRRASRDHARNCRQRLRGVVQSRGISQLCRLGRVAGCDIIGERRKSSAHLRRPWRASVQGSVPAPSRDPPRTMSACNYSLLTGIAVAPLRVGGCVRGSAGTATAASGGGGPLYVPSTPCWTQSFCTARSRLSAAFMSRTQDGSSTGSVGSGPYAPLAFFAYTP
jgi:hypothetical protein